MLTMPHIDHGKEFDWGLSSKDYARYRDIHPDYPAGTMIQRLREGADKLQ